MDYKETIESFLDQKTKVFVKNNRHVADAMRYAVLGGAKRIRATLVYKM